MKLTVQNAEIKTATVEMKTLTISGKQVTLAVFRQLRSGDWFAREQPRGLGWGTVNYHPDKACKDADLHLHVVWQLGDELRRAMVVRPNPYRKELGQVYAARTESDILRCPQLHSLASVEDHGNGVVATFPDQDKVFGPRLSGVAVRIEDHIWNWARPHECYEKCATSLRMALQSWSVSVLAALGDEEQWKAASSLPQLFIAV